jgi:hypothetical protein
MMVAMTHKTRGMGDVILARWFDEKYGALPILAYPGAEVVIDLGVVWEILFTVGNCIECISSDTLNI